MFNTNRSYPRDGKLRVKLVLGYRGPGRRFGVIPFANGRTFRLGAVAVHVWRLGSNDYAT